MTEPGGKDYVPSFGPASDQVMSVSWLDSRRGYLLLGRSCGGNHRRCAVVESTSDGGSTWTVQSHPPTDDGGYLEADCTTHTCVGRILFVTPDIGYLFNAGPTSAMLTTIDGGRTWTRQSGLSTDALTASGKLLWRLAYGHTGCPGPCDLVLQKSSLGTPRWTTVRDEGGSIGDDQILVTSSRLIVVRYGNLAGPEATATVDFSSSPDGIGPWTTAGDPCGPSRTANAADFAVDGDTTAVLCAPRASAIPSVLVATGGHLPTGPARRVPLQGAGGISLHGSTILATSGSSSGGGTYRYQVAESPDLGHSWRVTLTDPEAIGEDFPQSTPDGTLNVRTDGAASYVGYPYRLWQSTDDGETWQSSPVP